MADILERKIPYLFPGDLELRLDAQNFVTAISGYPVGGGGGTVVESDLMWKPVINSNGTLGWTRDTSATTPATADLVPHIYNNHWFVGTSDTNVEARGPQGDEGDPGYAPIITTKTVTAQGHDNSGTEITITYGEDGAQTAVYTAWNGNDGADATVTLTGGEGIEVSQAGTNYTISVSADYALKSDIPTTVAELTDSADYAKKTDLEGFVTSSDITTQDTDYVMTTTGWKVLSLPGGGMTQVIHDTTLTGQGNDNNSKLGVAWSALSGNTIASANSAYWAVKAKTNDGQHEYTIGTELASLNSIIQYLDGWAETAITGDQGVEVLDLDEDGYPETFQLTQTAYNAITSVSSKVDKPSSLVDKYLVLRTDSNGDVSGWCDFQDQSYSKSEALGTFVATANIDTTTLSGDGKSVSTKLGVKTDVIATRDYVNSSFLPTSGGTVSGQLVVSGDGNFDQENLKFIRSGQNGYGRIGLASNGALAVKVDDSNSNTTQINVAANASYNELIQVQHSGTTAYLIPAVTATTTAGLTNDGILHIILESE